MDSTYGQGIERRNFGDCNKAAPGEGGWTYRGEHGHQHCYVDPVGRLRIDWTTDGAHVFTRIWRNDNRWGPLYAASLKAQAIS